MTDKKLNTELSLGFVIELFARLGVGIPAMSWLSISPEISIEFVMRSVMTTAVFLWIFKPFFDGNYILIEKVKS